MVFSRTSDPCPTGRAGSDAGGVSATSRSSGPGNEAPPTSRAMIRADPEASPRGGVSRVFLRRAPETRSRLLDTGEMEKEESASPGEDGMGSGPQLLGDGDVLHALGRRGESAGTEPDTRRGGRPQVPLSSWDHWGGVSHTGGATHMRPRRRGFEFYRRTFPSGVTRCALLSHRAGWAWGCPNLNRSL